MALAMHTAVLAVLFQVSFSALPLPPIQTSAQIELVEAWAKEAKTASTAARVQLLALFDDDEFRSMLNSCCPDIASISADILLDRLRAEYRVAELAHSFWANFEDQKMQDTTVQLSLEYDFFMNQWQTQLALNETDGAAHGTWPANVPGCNVSAVGDWYPGQQGAPWGCSHVAEEFLFECPPFNLGNMPTWDEAASRYIYSCLNTRQSDVGSNPMYGDVTAIFNHSYVDGMVVISAVDSGNWEGSCRNNTNWHDNAFDCSSWSPPVLGTMEHLDHLILANLGLWAGARNRSVLEEAELLFSRSALHASGSQYDALPKLSYGAAGQYLEANIVGNPSLPDSVNFLVASFPKLFGTHAGQQVQQLSAVRGWPLVWAFGDGLPELDAGGADDEVFFGNRRILDPMVHTSNLLKGSINATMLPDASDLFSRLWHQVSYSRGTATHVEWESWWTTIAFEQTRVAPLTALSCSDLTMCLMVDASSGECICKEREEVTFEALV